MCLSVTSPFVRLVRKGVKTSSLSCSAAALGPEGVFEQNSLILEFLECQGILAVVQKCKSEGALDPCDWPVGVAVRTQASCRKPGGGGAGEGSQIQSGSEACRGQTGEWNLCGCS